MLSAERLILKIVYNVSRFVIQFFFCLAVFDNKTSTGIFWNFIKQMLRFTYCNSTELCCQVLSSDIFPSNRNTMTVDRQCRYRMHCQLIRNSMPAIHQSLRRDRTVSVAYDKMLYDRLETLRFVICFVGTMYHRMRHAMYYTLCF